jgi:hypothetical protein
MKEESHSNAVNPPFVYFFVTVSWPLLFVVVETGGVSRKEEKYEITKCDVVDFCRTRGREYTTSKYDDRSMANRTCFYFGLCLCLSV